MRIGVDATCWANERGYGRFAREMVSAMVQLSPSDDFICLLDRTSAACFELTAPNLRTVIVEMDAAPSAAASAAGNRRITDMLRMTRATARESMDVFFSPSVYTYFPLPPGLPAVVTIHDAIAERFPHLTVPSRRARLFWRLKVWLALKQADHVLTVSEYAARDIARIHHVPENRITVALEAPAKAYSPSLDMSDVRKAAARAGLPDGARWFIYVGGFNPHKNVPAIVRAHAALVKEMLVKESETSPPFLVLVGTLDRDVFHGDQAAIRQSIAECGTEAFVRWTGFVADEELRHLHSGAVALLIPSECEGFGLPAVEAAACGAPVIATIESPLPELLAGGGIFVTPGDAPALLAAMRTMTSDEPARLSLSAGALRAAGKLDWKRGAEATLQAIRSVSG